jgi:hypothetical protein
VGSGAADGGGCVADPPEVSDPASLEDDDPGQGKEAGAETQGLPRRFWLYALFTFFSVLGFASFQLISYHLQTRELWRKH